MIDLEPEDLSSEEFEAVLQSRGFQKMLLYHRLADGIEVLQEHDLLFDSMVSAITEQHSQFESEEATREFISLFVQEIRTYTEPFDDDLVDAVMEHEGDLTEDVGPDNDVERDGEAVLREEIEIKLAAEDPLELKANDLAADTGLHSTHVGSILGKWRKNEDGPFDVAASEAAGTGNIWTIASRAEASNSD
jgi:hypothetical protein